MINIFDKYRKVLIIKCKKICLYLRMAKTESEIKIILTDKEKNDLKSSIEKLTEKKIGFGNVDLTTDEATIIDYIKGL